LLAAGLGLALALHALLEHCIVEVRQGQALILVNRNEQTLHAWFRGYHTYLPGLFHTLGVVTIWPVNQEVVLHNVAMLDGPPITLRVLLTAQFCIPRDVTTLPRRDVPEAVARRDRMVAGFLYLAQTQPERWQQISGSAIEQALRDGFSTLRLDTVYDPSGAQVLPLDELRARLDTHLIATVEVDLAYSVRIRTVEVRDTDNQSILAWRQRAAQLQQMLALLADLAPEQVWMATQPAREMNGNAGTVQMNMDPSYLFWTQRTNTSADRADAQTKGRREAPR